MKISEIHIDGFGVWHDRTWTGLSEGVNVFCGPNEAGKTTLMSFIRSIIFGFERRSHSRRYEPLNGGKHGGSLALTVATGEIRVERKAGRHVRGAVQLHHRDGTGDEQMLEGVLGGTTRTVYHNVFAFGLEELEHFRTLQESEVASHISGAGLGVGATRWSRVHKDLEERRGKLFLPRGQNSTINRALKELETVRDELDRTEHEPEEYVAAHEEHLRVETRIKELDVSVGALTKRVDHYEKLRKALPHRQKRAAIESQLDDLETVDRFPEGGVERLNLLLHQRRQLESDLRKRSEDIEARRLKRVELATLYTPQELIRRSRGVDSLRILLPRLDSAGEIVDAAIAKRDAVRAECDLLGSSRDSARPPSGVAMAIFMTLVGLGAANLFMAEQIVPGSVVAAVMVGLTYWYHCRSRHAERLGRDLDAGRERLREVEIQLQRTRDQRTEIRSAIESHAGRSDFSIADLEKEAARVRRLTDMADEIRSIDNELSLEEKARIRTNDQIRENDLGMCALLEDGGAATEDEFFRRAELFRKRQDLQRELDRTPSAEVEAEPGWDKVDAVDDEAYAESVAALDVAKGQLAEAGRECGRLEERILTLGRSEERSNTRLRQESILARIDEASEKWAVLTLCRTLLDETRKIYESERQPDVLRHASEFFALLSEGRYVRVIAPLDSEDIVVEKCDGARVSPENLSRGTAEQLYLAMRLALVREYSEHVEPLPVIFDDIFVNFDPHRTRRSIDAVRDLSHTHQILLFTCHPHLLELVEEIVPDAQVFQLQ